MNDDEKLLLLLQLIRVNGNTEYLLRYNFTLTSLAETINKLQNSDYISYVDNKLLLTKKGDHLFRFLNKKIGRRGLYKYFNVDSTTKSVQYPIDAVYVPYKSQE